MAGCNTGKRKELPMSYIRACLAFGNGDLGRGRKIMFILASRLEEAREKHPLFAESAEEALKVIESKYRELQYATEQEFLDRQSDEALDVATAAMRFMNGEYLGRKNHA